MMNSTNSRQISDICEWMTCLYTIQHPTHPHQDSLQAFSSSIAGLLSSRAVLQGQQRLPTSHSHQTKQIQALESATQMPLQPPLSSCTSSRIHPGGSRRSSSHTGSAQPSSRNARCIGSPRISSMTSPWCLTASRQ
jgi:hypothetical protein